MPTNINIFFSNFRLGANVTIQRRLIDVTVNWTADDGTPRTDTRTVTFPDILALIPVDERDDLLREIALRAHRASLGVGTAPIIVPRERRNLIATLRDKAAGLMNRVKR